MDEKTLTALKASIVKWEDNAKVEEIKDALLGVFNCPLCTEFRRYGGDQGMISCLGCPVYTRTGLHGCDGSPYDKAREASSNVRFDNFEISDFHKAAQVEVDFLKSLLPEEKS